MTDPTPEPTDPRRRWLMIGGVAAAGLAGGAWFGLGRTPAPAGDTAPAPFWDLSFDTPAGSTLALAALRGKPLLVNFWATWCAPCVREMPEIDRFYNDFKSNGWQVVGLAIDGPTPVREFLGRVKVGFPIGLAGLDGTELVKTLGNERGGLPFTVAFDAAGRLVQRKLGETSYEELAGWARQIG
jgi:thiol-disulfide isomerase/thioredoxin